MGKSAESKAQERLKLGMDVGKAGHFDAVLEKLQKGRDWYTQPFDMMAVTLFLMTKSAPLCFQPIYDLHYLLVSGSHVESRPLFPYLSLTLYDLFEIHR